MQPLIKLFMRWVLVLRSLSQIRHPDGREASTRSRVPVHARFWREWAERASTGAPKRAAFARLG
jgi:hypothetical protein